MTRAYGQFQDSGIWFCLSSSHRIRRGPALILDRDGVVVEDIGFLSRPEDVVLVPLVVDLLREAVCAEIPIVIVTNQSGIDRGLFGWDEFFQVQHEIEWQLASRNIAIDLTIACPFHPEHTPSYGDEHAYWRKPGPGMLLFAQNTLNLDLQRSWMFGDKESDIEAANASGMRRAVFFRGKIGADPQFASAAITDNIEVRFADRRTCPKLKDLGLV